MHESRNLPWAVTVALAPFLAGCSISQNHDAVESESMVHQLQYDRWSQQELEERLEGERGETQEVAIELREQRKANRGTYRDLQASRQEDLDLGQELARVAGRVEEARTRVAAMKTEEESLANEAALGAERVARIQTEIRGHEETLRTLEGSMPGLVEQRVSIVMGSATSGSGSTEALEARFAELVAMRSSLELGIRALEEELAKKRMIAGEAPPVSQAQEVQPETDPAIQGSR